MSLNVNVTYTFQQEIYHKYEPPPEKTSSYDPERPLGGCPTDSEIIDEVKECAEKWCNIL